MAEIPWAHGICNGFCEHGAVFCCVDLTCCVPCTTGKMWLVYDLPGGFWGGCVSDAIPGINCLARAYLRQVVAQRHHHPFLPMDWFCDWCPDYICFQGWHVTLPPISTSLRSLHVTFLPAQHFTHFSRLTHMQTINGAVDHGLVPWPTEGQSQASYFNDTLFTKPKGAPDPMAFEGRDFEEDAKHTASIGTHRAVD